MVLTTPTASSSSTSAAAITSAVKSQVIVGASTPKSVIPIAPASKADATTGAGHVKVAKAKKPAKALVVDSKPHAVDSKPQAHASKAPLESAKHHPAVALAMYHVVPARKGRNQG